MEIVQGLWAIIYLFILQGLLLVWIIVQFWPYWVACILPIGLAVGIFMQRRQFGNLSAFLAAEILLLVFDALFDPERMFVRLFLDAKNFMTADGIRLFAIINLLAVIPFLIAIRLGYFVGRRIGRPKASAIEP